MSGSAVAPASGRRFSQGVRCCGTRSEHLRGVERELQAEALHYGSCLPAGRWRYSFFSMLGIAFALTFASVSFAAPTNNDEVIVPKGSSQRAEPPAASGATTGAFTFVAVLLLGGAGGWVLWRGRANGLGALQRGTRQLVVDETRSLGNRQFLVVASYRDRKFLLGVCPGRIDLLSHLDHEADDTEMTKARE